MRGTATAALLAVPLLATACAPSPQGQAFAAAKAAVQAAPGAPAHVRFNGLALHDLTGLKGSKAQVVCGVATDTKTTSDIPFIYVWKLAAAVSDPGVRGGQAILMTGAIDRRAANRLNHFCNADTPASTPNPYDFFQ